MRRGTRQHGSTDRDGGPEREDQGQGESHDGRESERRRTDGDPG